MRLGYSNSLFCAFFLGCVFTAFAHDNKDSSSWNVPEYNEQLIPEFVEPEKPLGIDPHLDSIVRPWLGTKHRIGRQSKDGIDCSGFVQVVLQCYLTYKTERSSAQNYLHGDSVSSENLLPGDVVFFVKHKRIYHSGVWIGNGRFAHSSSSHGVTVTQLFADPYWRTHYAGARRYVINPAFQNNPRPADSLPSFNTDP